jgi:hypothetical protein
MEEKTRTNPYMLSMIEGAIALASARRNFIKSLTLCIITTSSKKLSDHSSALQYSRAAERKRSILPSQENL